ncbi:MAG TPA: rod shape-determining protein MreD [Thermodesulfobacteriota bacterium]|nr:rod shape-determining protein MreD [Thermodesulfobacteriota bacterium]
MRRVGLCLALGAAALLLQATLLAYLPFGVLKPDLVLLFLLYLAVRADPVEGGAVAFALGYGMDLLSGSMFGTFTVTRVGIFYAAHLAAGRVYLTAGAMPAVAAALFTLAEALAVRFLFWMLGLTAEGLEHGLLRYLLPQALLMAILAPFAFRYLARLDPWLWPRGFGDDRRPVPLR